jgi:hypothetical protein
MFDPYFISVVRKVLSWTNDAPPCHYANTHESVVKMKKTKVGCPEAAKMMSLNEQILHLYVREYYPKYFSLEICHAGDEYARNYHSLAWEY